MIVLARAKGTIVLGDKEKRSSLERFGRNDISCRPMFINKESAGILFFWVERVNFGDFRNEKVFQFNGMIKGAVWR